MGDSKLIGISGAYPGPYHVENCTFKSAAMLWLTGGGGTNAVGVTPSGIIRRNWLHVPPSWLWSEPNPGGFPVWQVTIDGTRLGVTNASPFPGGPNGWGDAKFGPKRGCVMYELTTGIARDCVLYDAPESQFYTFQLANPWPTVPAGPIPVGFQYTAGDIETSPLVYNSGRVTPIPTATTTAGSRHVTLSAVLPQAVADEIIAGHTLYWYFNDTYWAGNGPQSANLVVDSWTQGAQANGWGWRQGVARAQALRKKIVGVDGNRLGFTYDATQDTLPAHTFAYSVVRFDGLYRNIYQHYKGSWENKTASRWVQEGNVFEHNTTRCYAADQPYGAGTVRAGDYIGHGTISGDDFTWTDTVWPGIQQNEHLRLGAPNLFGCLVPCATGGAVNEFIGIGRIVDTVTSPTTGRLRPIDPRYAAWTQGDCVNQGFAWLGSGTPWVTIYGQVFRYNIYARGAQPVVNSESSYTLKTIKGGQVSFHDNLVLRAGDLSWSDSSGAEHLGLAIPQRPFNGSPGLTYGPGGAAVYDEPPSSGCQGTWRQDHNTFARSETLVIKGVGALIAGVAPNDIGEKAKGVSVRDNVVIDANGANVYPMSDYSPYSEAPNTATSWDPAATIVAGNVLHGTGSLVPKFAVWNHAGTNACFADVAALGLPNYANGAVDGFNLANYAFADVFNTGTVAIAANGLDVTLEGGGTFPAVVRRGQGFRVIGQPAVPIAQGTEGVLSAAWSLYTNGGSFIKSDGAAPTNSVQHNIVTHTTAVANDQWVQATVVPGTFVALVLRWAAPNTLSGYYGSWDGRSGSPTFSIYRTSNLDTFTLLGTATPGTLAPGSVLAFEVEGTTFRLLANGTPVVTAAATGDTTYPSGRIGIFSEASLATRYTNLTAGPFSSPGVRGAATITDAFSSATSVISLASPYPLANVTGQAFGIGLKFAATDGTDPGADLTTLGLMTAGVRNPARAYD